MENKINESFEFYSDFRPIKRASKSDEKSLGKQFSKLFLHFPRTTEIYLTKKEELCTNRFFFSFFGCFSITVVDYD